MPDYWATFFPTNSCTKEMPVEEYRCLVEEEEPIRYSYETS